jgi:hypothetical protein
LQDPPKLPKSDFWFENMPSGNPESERLNFVQSGADVNILKIFSPKKSTKKLASVTRNKAKVCKILIITLVFEKNANFFAEIGKNRRKL